MPSEGQYKELRRQIEENPDCCGFAPFGEHCSDELLALAEERLGLPLPPSYRWWCRHFGGGILGYSYELSSVYWEGPDDPCPAGDIAYLAKINRENSRHGTELLELLNHDGGEVFYFDTTRRDDEGEYPVVVRYAPGSCEPYAANFLEFLKKRIEFMGQA